MDGSFFFFFPLSSVTLHTNVRPRGVGWRVSWHTAGEATTRGGWKPSEELRFFKKCSVFALRPVSGPPGIRHGTHQQLLPL